MTYQMPSKNVSSLPVPSIVYTPKPFYSLYKKIDGRWFQVRVQSYPLMFAIKVWSDEIANQPKVYSIRKASFDYNEAR